MIKFSSSNIMCINISRAFAFTKHSHIQYFNHLNARRDESHKKHSTIYGIQQKETYQTEKGKRLVKPPIPIDEFRKEKKYITNIHLTDFEDVTPAVDYNEGELKLDEQSLRSLLNRLPDVTQKVFNMYAIDGYKHREISDYLSISEGTSKWHVSDARKKLKAMLVEVRQREERTIELKQ